ncbi:RimK/LysX family protein [Candidatus Woesearchaeota archaeon]|nr:RimK/LysX family protein [Candidatus Woesearchaeota archaeon]
MNDKSVLGLTTSCVLFGKKKKKEVVARVDTGATKSSIDERLALEIGVGPELKKTLVKSAHGTRQRPVIVVDLMVGGQMKRSEFTLADRAHLKYPVLIGQNVLKSGFMIDPSRKLK